MNQPPPARIGILTASDRASRGDYEDRSGPAVRDYLAEVLTVRWTPVARVVSDTQSEVEAALRALADEENCCLIITSGGTGPAPRDRVPEATAAVCERMLPGFGERMRAVSLPEVPTAILSRQTAGIRGRTLILNLPGRPRAIRTCLDAVFPAVPDCLDLLGGPYLTTDATKVKAYRPDTPSGAE